MLRLWNTGWTSPGLGVGLFLSSIKSSGGERERCRVSLYSYLQPSPLLDDFCSVGERPYMSHPPSVSLSVCLSSSELKCFALPLKTGRYNKKNPVTFLCWIKKKKNNRRMSSAGFFLNKSPVKGLLWWTSYSKTSVCLSVCLSHSHSLTLLVPYVTKSVVTH